MGQLRLTYSGRGHVEGMSHIPRDPSREQRFTSVYDAVYPDLVKFVQRRANPDHVEDVVADAFMVVWRRLDSLPGRDEDARAWIFGVTRNIMLNNERGDQRRRALGVRLADPTLLPIADPSADLPVSRLDLARAWRRLSELHQEALALAVFEDLTAPEAAAVLGISPVAFRLRLSRARRALRLHLDHLPQPFGASAGTPERTPTS